MIKLESVCKSFRIGEQECKVLHDLSFTIERKEFVAILGRSGSGKSTTMNLLGLLDTPTAGNYFLDGHDVSKIDDDKKASIRNQLIGFVFQQFLLLPRMNVVENISLPLLYRGLSIHEAAERAKEMLEMVDMQAFHAAMPATLSGGQQQRIAIARALVGKPGLVLADEPTGALDSENGQMVLDVLRRLNKELGVTIVMITHDLELAEASHRILYLADGRLVKERICK